MLRVLKIVFNFFKCFFFEFNSLKKGLNLDVLKKSNFDFVKSFCKKFCLFLFIFSILNINLFFKFIFIFIFSFLEPLLLTNLFLFFSKYFSWYGVGAKQIGARLDLKHKLIFSSQLISSFLAKRDISSSGLFLYEFK